MKLQNDIKKIQNHKNIGAFNYCDIFGQMWEINRKKTTEMLNKYSILVQAI